MAFSVSFERHWQRGINGIAKVPKLFHQDSNPGPLGRQSCDLTTDPRSCPHTHRPPPPIATAPQYDIIIWLCLDTFRFDHIDDTFVLGHISQRVHLVTCGARKGCYLEGQTFHQLTLPGVIVTWATFLSLQD